MSETKQEAQSPEDVVMGGEDLVTNEDEVDPTPRTRSKLASTMQRPRPPPPEDPDQTSSGVADSSPMFTLPTKRVFLRYGDCVTLFEKTASRGFLNADGVIDESLRIIKMRDGSVPDKIRDCVFKIMPSQQYSAQREFRKKVKLLQIAVAEEVAGNSEDTTGAEEDENYYMSLQESAERELEMNEEHNREKILNDTVVRYGQVVQLLHYKTNKYITADTKKVASAEKDCQYTGIEEGGSAYSWFTILPRYKMRSLGDEVETSDSVVFELCKQEGTFLHCYCAQPPSCSYTTTKYAR